jgi:carbohydrate-binding DOMON domain-containing protein
MPKMRMLLLVLAALALASGSAQAAKVVIKDATGDDNGPGNYTYPTDAVYTAGSFDIKEFSLEAKGENADIDVEIAGRLEDSWRMGSGFSVQMVFVFIDNAPGGFTEAPAGLNIAFDPSTAWDVCVILSPQQMSRVQQEVTAKGGKMTNQIIVPARVRGNRSTISCSVPVAKLGAGDPATWKYEVVMQSNEGFPAPGDLLIRKVNEFEGQHRFGGGTDYDCDPNVMDILGDQKQLANYECKEDGTTVKLATITLVTP